MGGPLPGMGGETRYYAPFIRLFHDAYIVRGEKGVVLKNAARLPEGGCLYGSSVVGGGGGREERLLREGGFIKSLDPGTDP